MQQETKTADLTEMSHTRHNWGPLLFGAFVGGAMLFYAWSVMGTARNITDYLLILPGAVIGATAALWAGVADRKPLKGFVTATHPALRDEAKPIALMVLTILYACAAPFLGFDIATALFIALALVLQGVRSWWRIALTALPGALLMTWVFTRLLVVRLPVSLF